MTAVHKTTELHLPLLHRGKVRDLYDLDDGRLLLVATDRLSAFDVVLAAAIPDKGRVLTQLSKFWAAKLEAARPFHLRTDDVYAMGPEVLAYAEALQGRTMLVDRLEMLPVECVVRRYLVGSGFKDYRATGSVCGHALPEGLVQGARLDPPVFTPATKAAVGEHDENIDAARFAEILGPARATELQRRSLAIFREAEAFAAARGLVLVDTKFEFGLLPDGTLVLGDELLTPDSSRYWDAAEAAATPQGQTPPSFDKQIVRDYLESVGWNKQPPPPDLPEAIVARTAARYRELFERLTGTPLSVLKD